MNTTKLSAIIIKPNRQRTEFDPQHVQALRDSIELSDKRNTQLLHPPVLRREDGQLTLVAGETRLKAISEIFAMGGSFLHNGQLFTAEAGEIPYSDLGELSPLEAEEAELDENLKRKDLTWQEHAAAMQRLHNLRKAQNPIVTIVSSESDPLDPTLNKTITSGSTHTIADTAKEVYGRSDGYFQDSVRKEVLVAAHLDNPIIAKAKSADEAFKIIKKDEERKRNERLAAVVGATFNADKHSLYNRSCLDYMEEAQLFTESDKFDVICTDPPYGMGADNFGDAGGKMSGIEHHYDDSYESWKVLMEQWCDLSYYICKERAHAYVFCDFDRFHELKAMMQKAGWYVFRTPIIVHKLNSGRVPLPDQGPRRQYEIILYAIKGKKNTTHIYPDVIAVQGDENMSHGAQKPVALMQNLLQRSVRPGDRVFDGFAGTGPTFEAGHGYKCTVIGCEISQEYYAMSLQRIQQLKALESPDMFS